MKRLQRFSGCFVVLVWLAWYAAFAPHSVTAQEETLSLERAVREGRIEVRRLSGRSPTFFEPMIVLEARNLSGAPVRVEPTQGSILQSDNSQFCDVIVQSADTPIYFDGSSPEPFSFYLHGYCQQLAPTERAFPSAQASYALTDRMADPAVLAVLERITAEGLQKSLAGQLGIWLAQHQISDLAALQERLATGDLSNYHSAVAKLIATASSDAPATARFEQTATLAPPTASAESATAAPSAPVVEPSSTPVWPLALTAVIVVSAFLLFGYVLFRVRPKEPTILPLRQPENVTPQPKPSPTKAPPPTPQPKKKQSVTASPGGNRQSARASFQPEGPTGPIVARPTPESRTPAEKQPDAPPNAQSDSTSGADVSKTVSLEGSAPAQGQGESVKLKPIRPEPQDAIDVPASGGVLSRADESKVYFLQLADPSISTPHALIHYDRQLDRFTLKDLASETGTLVDQQSANKPLILNPGCKLKLGNTVLTFQRAPDRLVSDTKDVLKLEAGNRWLLTRDRVTFITLDRLKDNHISAPHAFLEVRDNRILVRDLNSTGGTYVHGERISRSTQLVHDDLLRLGQTEFEINSGFDYLLDTILAEGGRTLVKIKDVWDQENGNVYKEGGMARIYRFEFEDSPQDRRIVKLPRLGQYRRTSPEGLNYRYAFENEVAANKKIENREISLPDARIVKVFERTYVSILQNSETVPCLIMEYVDGHSLAELLKVLPSLPAQFVVKVASRTAALLQEIHQKAGYIHCDVSPSNVLVSTGGYVYLNDLGIATPIGTSPPKFKKPGFWPPEMGNRPGSPGLATVQPQLDVYSLGVLMFQCLTGRAFSPVTQTAPSVGSVGGAPSARDSMKELGCDDALIEVVLICLRPDPNERLRSMSAVLERLNPLVDEHYDLADRMAEWAVQYPL